VCVWGVQDITSRFHLLSLRRSRTPLSCLSHSSPSPLPLLSLSAACRRLPLCPWHLVCLPVSISLAFSLSLSRSRFLSLAFSLSLSACVWKAARELAGRCAWQPFAARHMSLPTGICPPPPSCPLVSLSPCLYLFVFPSSRSSLRPHTLVA
jgi:hypothetical protein